jgi:formylglycine-generating enzyme required for sulfatase activity
MKFATAALLLTMVLLMYSIPGKDNSVASINPPACVQVGQKWISPIDGAELICVPGGNFLMGASELDTQAGEDEKPQHTVYLRPFWIDRTEVTNARVARCMAAGACHPEYYETTALTYVPYSVHPEYQNHPTLIYQYEDAEDYCRWAGRRMPTEAEWEKAARSPDGRAYPWGNSLDCDHANYYICNHVPEYDPKGPRCGYSSFCRTAKVDDYPAGSSPYGALNLAGNVWEWVSDFYSPDYYAISPEENPTGPESGEFRTRRGGGSTSLSADLRVTVRASGKGEHYYDGQMGFRCAANAPE